MEIRNFLNILRIRIFNYLLQFDITHSVFKLIMI